MLNFINGPFIVWNYYTPKLPRIGLEIFWKRRQWHRSSVFIVNFEYISGIVLQFTTDIEQVPAELQYAKSSCSLVLYKILQNLKEKYKRAPPMVFSYEFCGGFFETAIYQTFLNTVSCVHATEVQRNNVNLVKLFTELLINRQNLATYRREASVGPTILNPRFSKHFQALVEPPVFSNTTRDFKMSFLQ